jgi:hypothetical protein
MQGRPLSNAPNPDYPRLHDISRHAIHVEETLDRAVHVARDIARQQQQFSIDRLSGDLSSLSRQRHRRLCFFENMLGSLCARASSNKQRLDNEINLVRFTVPFKIPEALRSWAGVQHSGSVRQQHLSADRESHANRQLQHEDYRHRDACLPTRNLHLR